MPATLLDLVDPNAETLNDPTPPWNRQPFILTMALVFGFITTIAVCLRLYTRFWVVKMPGWDDYVQLLMLLVGSIGLVCICLAPGLGGLGRHIVEIPDEQRRTYFQLFYLADGSFVTTVFLIKLALLLQYLRVFTSGVQRYILKGTIGVVLCFGILTSFFVWFPCFPIEAFWDSTITNKRCYAYGATEVEEFYMTYLAHGIINMVLDIVILAIPIQLLFRPNTTTRTRLGIVGLLVIGTIATVLAAIRLAATVRTRAFTYPSYDHSWYAPELCILGMLEVNMGCIGASIPVFWPVIRERLGIFVTREVNISVSERHEEIDRQRPESLYSNGSERALRLWPENKPKPAKGDHYKDSYVLEQVDPLRKKTTAQVDSVVTAGKTKP